MYFVAKSPQALRHILRTAGYKVFLATQIQIP